MANDVRACGYIQLEEGAVLDFTSPLENGEKDSGTDTVAGEGGDNNGTNNKDNEDNEENTKKR